jgi:DNA-binding XRE family transcriptional regulator
MRKFDSFKKELLSDKEIKREYDRLGTEYQIAAEIIRKRIQSGMTQGELAKKVGTKQSAISRLESGNYNPSVLLLSKIANALEAKFQFSLD